MISESYGNILFEHNSFLNKAVQIMFENICLKKSDGDFDKKYDKLSPDNAGYVDLMSLDLKDTRTAINKINTDRSSVYKDAVEKVNPVGLDVPKIDTEDDDNIKKYYDELRTVILDKFNEACNIDNSGGEGWIRFIDTLATPEERAQNYKIPNFDSVYTLFVKHQKSSKVTKDDVMAAINIINSYDKNMKKLIKEASDYSEERSKWIYKFNSEGSPLTFHESGQYLSFATFINEQDFLMSQSLEIRKQVLIENVKMAHRVLNGLCSHNPRDIRESAPVVEFNNQIIDSILDDASAAPSNYLPVKVELSEKDAKIKNIVMNFENKIQKINNRLLESYKDFALSSKCISVFVENWLVPDKDKVALNASHVLNTKYDHNFLSKCTNEQLESLYESMNGLNSIFETKSPADCEKITSPLVKAIANEYVVNPYIVTTDSDVSHIPVEKVHTVTKEDVIESVKCLESCGARMNNIKQSIGAYQISYNTLHESLSVPTHKVSPRERLVMNIEKGRNKAAHTMNMVNLQSVVREFCLLNNRARKTILKTSRIVSESALDKEREDIMQIEEACSKFIKELTEAIESN